jgi:hypothetical protein
MGATSVETLSLEEREHFAAAVERMRQLRRRTGVPDGVTAAEAVALHMVSAEELERAWRGDLGPAATAAGQEGPDGVA